jgi:hypothetical protein
MKYLTFLRKAVSSETTWSRTHERSMRRGEFAITENACIEINIKCAMKPLQSHPYSMLL